MDRTHPAFIAACEAFNNAPQCPELALAEAIAAYEKALWQPIETAPAFTRMIVSGYQRQTGTVAGYWWTEQEETDDHGRPVHHPDATLWRPWPTPPEEV